MTSLTPVLGSGPPLLTVLEIKTQLRIEPTQTVEDEYLATLEIAARAHTELVLRKPLVSGTVTQNIKQALLMLIAHWYRNREAVTLGRQMEGFVLPLAYEALLFPERDYPSGVY